jgi:hypothetical protein
VLAHKKGDCSQPQLATPRANYFLLVYPIVLDLCLDPDWFLPQSLMLLFLKMTGVKRNADVKMMQAVILSLVNAIAPLGGLDHIASRVVQKELTVHIAGENIFGCLILKLILKLIVIRALLKGTLTGYLLRVFQ